METSFPRDLVLRSGLSEDPTGSLAGIRRRAAEKDGAAGASKELEALFATLLVKEMRRGVAGGLFGEGSTGDIYGGWFDEHVGGVLAESGAIDLAGQIKTSLLAKSEAARAGRPAEHPPEHPPEHPEEP